MIDVPSLASSFIFMNQGSRLKALTLPMEKVWLELYLVLFSSPDLPATYCVHVLKETLPSSSVFEGFVNVTDNRVHHCFR